LKPSNIMLVKNKVSGGEIVKVVDFGIAKLTGVDEFNQQTLTKTGEIFGSPLYMSPEQCMGTALDHRSDLYSLGCVFYEALTSAPPFLGESALATMMKHQGETQLSLKEGSLGIQYPEELELIIAKLLEKDPNHRYQTGEALAKDLIRLENSFQKTDASDPIVSAADRAGQSDTIYDGKGLKRNSAHGDFQRRKFLNDPLSLTVAASVVFAAGAGCSYLLNKQTDAARTAKAQSASMGASVLTKEQIKLANAYQKSIEVRDTWSTLAGDKRQFFFPIGEDLGTIVLDTGKQIPATGQFSIPAKQSFGVIANKNLLNDLSKLKKFENDDAAVFDFKGVTPPKGAYEIVARFKNLRGLNVFSCEFYDEDLELFKSQMSLLSLNIGNTAVTGKALLKFPPLKNINCLDISYMDAPQMLLPKIKEFPKLKQLMARKSDIRDEHISMLADSNIKVASLAWNYKLSKNFAQNLSKSKSLEVLNLSATKLSPADVVQLTRIPTLRRIVVGTLPWGNELKTYIKKTFASEHPKMTLVWKDEFTSDHSAAMPAFQWKGEGLVAHECPIATLARETF
ncbi:MAG: serine/threonine protein kinase, partial [Leptolyngbya sp.]|nr:serine/threonine protein kinase [Candidatus Melainabacteria bacterium]